MLKQSVLAAVAMLALAACERHLDTSKATAPEKMAATGTSGNLMGTPPAPPSGPENTGTPVDPNKPLTETAQTTSNAEGSKELTKSEESRSMPLPGQPNDHSNVAPDASQKAGQTDPQMQSERSDAAGSPQRESQSTSK